MFAYTSKNILLVNGIILCVFLRNNCKFLNVRLNCIFCPLISKDFAYF